MNPTILFLHGFFASGVCVPAQTLKQCFQDQATVLTPDLPLHPAEALASIFRWCEQEKPDVLVGNSNGSFLAQIVAARNNLPALLGNPHFEMTRFLAERIGTHEYKSPRADGNQRLVIDQALIEEFADLQLHQWDNDRQPRTNMGTLRRERPPGPLRTALSETLHPRLPLPRRTYPHRGGSAHVLRPPGGTTTGKTQRRWTAIGTSSAAECSAPKARS